MNTAYASKPDIIDLYQNSTAIDMIAYDASRHALYVEWSTGNVYRYDGVMPDVVADACSASSIGRFVNLNVNGSYPCEYVCCHLDSEYKRLFR